MSIPPGGAPPKAVRPSSKVWRGARGCFFKSAPRYECLFNFGDVMVVGGGISGIQASLDLATAGFKVYLVEKGPSHRRPHGPAGQDLPDQRLLHVNTLAQTGRGRPASKYRGLTYTEVKVEGEAGDFKVTLTKKPRYIIEDKCTGCATCVKYCPVQYPDPFQSGNIHKQGDSYLFPRPYRWSPTSTRAACT
jgi:heterodisulfide reductase subunit A